jgi:lipopolysaccharide/colanic/teichoic acid biosynthesis glycosyltransferase
MPSAEHRKPFTGKPPLPETLAILDSADADGTRPVVAGDADPGLPASAPPATECDAPTVFGLTLSQLHARYWAARGVQVVRRGEASAIVRDAELYLLLPPGKLALFPLAGLMDTLNWVHPHLLFLRLNDPRNQRYREEVLADASDRFVRFRRLYRGAGREHGSAQRAALTSRRDIAKVWQQSADGDGWRILRRSGGRAYASARGTFYDPADDSEAAQFVQDLLRAWPQPETSITRAKPIAEKNGDASSLLKTRCVPVLFRDESAAISPDAQLVGPVWVGAGRTIGAGQTIIGPAIAWDDPAAAPAARGIEWQTIEPTSSLAAGAVRGRHGPGLVRLVDSALQRGFDIVFSLVAITLTLPLYPFILAVIWIEDGRPFFFAHRRESRGGKPFGCIKFRSMRKNAEAMKARLAAANRADGPQFYIPNDPRLTRIGKFLRKTNLDELPQFFNVLLGQMAVVGPRPSPHAENQFCPAWREARLSVRPGITGLWQVCRTRKHGADFQEWIRYDIEYVERRSLWLDLEILVRTVAMVVGLTH